MSLQVNTTATYTFQNNLELQLNQVKSMLIDAVETQDVTGEKVAIRDIFGNVAPQIANERHGDTRYVNTPHDRVWLAKPDERYFAELVDTADQLATEISLQGGYTMSAMGTINRAWDDQILIGAYGNIVSGKDGTVTTPFPAGNIVPVTTGGAAGAQHMNVAKMRAANLMLMQNFVDVQQEKFMVLSSIQIDDLLGEVPATSADFKGSYGGEFDNGVLKRFMGFTIIPMELKNPTLEAVIKGVTTDGSGYTKNPFWVKSGIRLGIWEKLRTSVDRLPTKLFSTQVFAGTTVAATRTQAGKVGIILNSEA